VQKLSKSLVWFRRDLRDYDHAALYHALRNSNQVFCIFVFDTDILGLLKNKADRRVEFIWESVMELKAAFQSHGGDLIVAHGSACNIIPQQAKTLGVNAVFSNQDYEPSAIERDANVAQQLAKVSIEFHQFKDQVIFEKDEVLTQQGKPYGVFTPYKNAHLKKLNDFYLKPYPSDRYFSHLAPHQANAMPDLKDLGFQRTNLSEMKLPTGMQGAKVLFEDFITRINQYREARDYPAVKGPSYLSVHLRFGTISIRHLARTAWQMAGASAETWLSELIWRDFYFQILHHHPKIACSQTYKAEFNGLNFSNELALFKAWCKGKTGYPLVDAAMRQLNQTGYMHNRLRMVVASFLVKDLLIDWRWGERYFSENLIDFDFSANNGGWQWAASTGCDAQPWFRIFNPITQSEKFDPLGKFIRKYVPELASCNDKEIHAPWLIPAMRQTMLALKIGESYPEPIVNHAVQREKALSLYKAAS
jgi:deoxyribodipyrimidine photo-lyase